MQVPSEDGHLRFEKNSKRNPNVQDFPLTADRAGRSSVMKIELSPIYVVSAPCLPTQSEEQCGSIMQKRYNRSKSSYRVALSAAALVVAVLCFAQSWEQHVTSRGKEGAINRAHPSTLSEDWVRDTLAQDVSDPEDETVQMARWDKSDMQSQASAATSVGGKLQDDVRIGLVIGHMTQIAFDTVVELKRTIRGLREDKNNDWLSSKIQVRRLRTQIEVHAQLHLWVEDCTL